MKKLSLLTTATYSVVIYHKPPPTTFRLKAKSITTELEEEGGIYY